MNVKLLINSLKKNINSIEIIHNYIKSKNSECIIGGKYIRIKIPNSTLNKPINKKNKEDVIFNKRLKEYYEEYKSSKLDQLKIAESVNAQLKVAELVSSNEIQFSKEDKIYLSITFLFCRDNNKKFDLDNYIKKTVDGVALGLFKTNCYIKSKKNSIESIKFTDSDKEELSNSDNFEKLKKVTSNLFNQNDYIIEKILAEKIIIKNTNEKNYKEKEGVIISLFKENKTE